MHQFGYFVREAVDCTLKIWAYLCMRTTIELPDPLFRVAKTLASEKGISLKDFFTDALQKAVSQPPSRGLRMDSPPIRLARGKRIPFRSNAQLAEFLENEELGKLR